MFISFFKLTVFVVLIALVTFSIKGIVLSRLKEKNIFNAVYKSQHAVSGNFYFIGSSRTRCAVNDSLLNKSFTRFRFINTGLGYGTFISNAVLANKLMKSIDSAVIFIELSVANGRMPYTFSLVADPLHTISAIWPLVKTTTLEDMYHIYGPFAENYLIDYINPKPYMKLSAGNYRLTDFFGQMKKYESLPYHPVSVLTAEDFKTIQTVQADVPVIYHTILKQLLETATQTNSRIVFLLPVCISNGEEKNRLLAIYKIIPENNKLYYNTSFLKTINNPLYLADDMHLNVKGADIYTNYLKEIIAGLIKSSY